MKDKTNSEADQPLAIEGLGPKNENNPADGEPTIPTTLGGRVENVAIEELRPSDRSREIYGGDVPLALLKSIEAEGIKTPLSVTAQGKVLSGNSRYRAALALHLHTVPVIRVPDPVSRTRETVEVLTANAGRVKSNEQMTREFLAWLEIEKLNVGVEDGEKTRHRAAARVGVGASSLEKGVAIIRTIDSLIREGETQQAQDLRRELNEKGFQPAMQRAIDHGLVKLGTRRRKSARGSAAPQESPPAPNPKEERFEHHAVAMDKRLGAEGGDASGEVNLGQQISQHIKALAQLEGFLIKTAADEWPEGARESLELQYHRTGRALAKATNEKSTPVAN